MEWFGLDLTDIGDESPVVHTEQDCGLEFSNPGLPTN